MLSIAAARPEPAPRIEPCHQIGAQTGDAGEQRARQRVQPPLPGPSCGEAPVDGQPLTERLHFAGRLLQDRQQPIDGRDIAHQHDHHGLQEEPIRVRGRSTTPPRGQRTRYGVDQIHEEDEQRDLRYHRIAYPVWCDAPMVGAPAPPVFWPVGPAIYDRASSSSVEVERASRAPFRHVHGPEPAVGLTVERWQHFERLGFDSAWDCDHSMTSPAGPPVRTTRGGPSSPGWRQHQERDPHRRPGQLQHVPPPGPPGPRGDDRRPHLERPVELGSGPAGSSPSTSSSASPSRRRRSWWADSGRPWRSSMACSATRSRRTRGSTTS